MQFRVFLYFLRQAAFLISPAWEQRPPTNGYSINHTLRIFTALFLFFFVSIISLLIVSPETLFQASLVEFVGLIFAQLTASQFFNPAFFREYGVGVLNGSVWTILVELQFYFALPIVYWMLRLQTPCEGVYLLAVVFAFFGWGCLINC